MPAGAITRVEREAARKAVQALRARPADVNGLVWARITLQTGRRRTSCLLQKLPGEQDPTRAGQGFRQPPLCWNSVQRQQGTRQAGMQGLLYRSSAMPRRFWRASRAKAARIPAPVLRRDRKASTALPGPFPAKSSVPP